MFQVLLLVLSCLFVFKTFLLDKARVLKKNDKNLFEISKTSSRWTLLTKGANLCCIDSKRMMLDMQGRSVKMFHLL